MTEIPTCMVSIVKSRAVLSARLSAQPQGELSLVNEREKHADKDLTCLNEKLTCC